MNPTKKKKMFADEYEKYILNLADDLRIYKETLLEVVDERNKETGSTKASDVLDEDFAMDAFLYHVKKMYDRYYGMRSMVKQAKEILEDLENE